MHFDNPASKANSPQATIFRTVSRQQLPVLLRLLLVAGIATPLALEPARGAEPQAAPPAPPGVRVLRDLEYVPGGHERNRLDLYLSEKAARPLPVIVWEHGGGWTNGDKPHGPAFRFATNGYAVASINYRFSQHAIFPAQIHD